MTRPLRGPLNSSDVDHSTDAYDTIEWLVKNVPESNGKVGMLGSSYPGFTVVMALVNPHPALKVAAPMSPMVDGWMGDDWFHFGAFRQVNMDYFTRQTTARGSGSLIARQGYDDYDNFLRAGSAGAMDIFRGRYREGFETPKPIEANTPLTYKFALPTVNHVFLPRHRIMVQVQSSWFPLYDRNPQKFVPNIFFAKLEDYVKATERVYHAPGAASFIALPVVPSAR
jgi:predicted acyl esterase